MKRREFFGKAGIGSAALAVTGMGTAALAAHPADEHEHDPVTGPLASATVSFGQWQTTPPFDRFENALDRFRNQHQLIPAEVTIRAGGSVNFIISGLHLVLIYGDGTQPADVNVNLTMNVPPGPPLINDPANRIYRGLHPGTLGPVQDRVEVVHFHDPGIYLVMCGVLPHFAEGMFGYVQVLPCHCQR
jgi:plastocyanin